MISLTGLIIVGCLVRLFNGDKDEKMAVTGARKTRLVVFHAVSRRLHDDTWRMEDCKCVALANQWEPGCQSFNWHLFHGKAGFHDTGASSTWHPRRQPPIFGSRCNSAFQAFERCVCVHKNEWKSSLKTGQRAQQRPVLFAVHLLFHICPLHFLL